MSEIQNKKIKKQVKKHLKVELKEVATSFQSLIIKFPFKKRLKIAWLIIKGKSFLHGVDIPS